MLSSILLRHCVKSVRFGLVTAFVMGASTLPSNALWNGHAKPFQSSSSFTVLLKISGEKQLDCSGVLIAPRLVLTAGHCLHGARSVKVMAQTRSGIQMINADDWSVHPSWNAGLSVNGWDAQINSGNGDRYIDLAVLRLEAEPASAQPIDLGSVEGAGSLKTYGYARTALLEPLHSIDSSSADYVQRLSPRGPLKVYASGGSAWCQGDSGGPVTSRGNGSEKLIGIVGLGLGAIDYDETSALSMRWGGKQRVPKCGSYAYVQDVALHADWILRTSASLQRSEDLTASIRSNERMDNRN